MPGSGYSIRFQFSRAFLFAFSDLWSFAGIYLFAVGPVRLIVTVPMRGPVKTDTSAT